jgi:hypothetical protein
VADSAAAYLIDRRDVARLSAAAVPPRTSSKLQRCTKWTYFRFSGAILQGILSSFCNSLVLMLFSAVSQGFMTVANSAAASLPLHS